VTVTRALVALVRVPKASWLVSADRGGEGRIWDPATGAARHTLTGHTSTVWALEAAPDGSWLASAGYGGQVRIWDPATGAARHTLIGHTSRVLAWVVAPDGSWLASAGRDGELRIWNPLTGAALTSLRVAGGYPISHWHRQRSQQPENAVSISWHSAAPPIWIGAMTDQTWSVARRRSEGFLPVG
jgi:WD40 repeat protein